AETGMLVERELGTASAQTVRTLHELSGGNPFLLQELIGAVGPDEADRATATTRLPAGARELVRQRLAGLPAACVEIVHAAAVLGTTFDQAPLERLFGFDALGFVGALEPAMRKGLVRAQADELRRFAFAHGLLRDAIYADLAPTERLLLHGRLGDALAADPAAPSTRALAALAHHYFEAA